MWLTKISMMGRMVSFVMMMSMQEFPARPGSQVARLDFDIRALGEDSLAGNFAYLDNVCLRAAITL